MRTSWRALSPLLVPVLVLVALGAAWGLGYRRATVALSAQVAAAEAALALKDVQLQHAVGAADAGRAALTHTADSVDALRETATALRARLAAQVGVNRGLAHMALTEDARADSLGARLAWRELLQTADATIAAQDTALAACGAFTRACRQQAATDSTLIRTLSTTLADARAQQARVTVLADARAATAERRATRRARWSQVRSVVGCAGGVLTLREVLPRRVSDPSIAAATCALGGAVGASAPTVLRLPFP